MIAEPSLDHVGCESIAVPSVNRVAVCSTPSFAIHSDVSDSGRPRLDANTIHAPSGEIAGCVSRVVP
jgi:hypothetical protein